MSVHFEDLLISHNPEPQPKTRELERCQAPQSVATCPRRAEWKAVLRRGDGYYLWYLCEHHASPEVARQLLAREPGPGHRVERPRSQLLDHLVILRPDTHGQPEVTCQDPGCAKDAKWMARIMETKLRWWLCEQHASPVTVRTLLESADLDS